MKNEKLKASQQFRELNGLPVAVKPDRVEVKAILLLAKKYVDSKTLW